MLSCMSQSFLYKTMGIINMYPSDVILLKCSVLKGLKNVMKI